MRARGLFVLLGAQLLIAGAGFSFLQRTTGTPDETAGAYLTAWGNGNLERMRGLVSDPPKDFLQQHRRLAAALKVEEIELKPGRWERRAESARLEFTVTRLLGGLGEWQFTSTLRVGIRERQWKVLWSPGTLHPVLANGGELRLSEIEAAAFRLVARDGQAMPEHSTAQPYIAQLSVAYGEPADDPGWAIEAVLPDGAVHRLKTFSLPRAKTLRTTLDRRLQGRADQAIAGATAALVVVRPSTGEILAVADRLSGARNAFLGLYPPGSSFKVVTAAALLGTGVSPDSTHDCPAAVTAGGRAFRNAEGFAAGAVSFRLAFAHSCNTTFAPLAVQHLRDGRLGRHAATLGFGATVWPGMDAAAASFPRPGGDTELAEAAIGQGRVLASPLTMALVAAAVRDGTWRPPYLVDPKLANENRERPPSRRLDPSVASALRSMMTAAVTDGTAARVGLPHGTGGKTGTAEYGTGEHAWFIGYSGDLAFAVLVENGGAGARVAAPIANRFLRG